MFFHHRELDKERLASEIGDTMWYIAAICTTLGLKLSDVMEQNIQKLNKRYPEGYSAKGSIERLDEQ